MVAAFPARPIVSVPLPRRRIIRSLPLKVKVGGGILGFFVLIAIIGPAIAPYDPSATSAQVMPLPPNFHHLLGTTSSGQDVLSQLLVGLRSTVVLGLLTGLIATVLAVGVGVSAGFLGGWADEVLSLVTNVFLVLPALPLLIVLLGYLPPSSGQLPTAVVLSALGWPWGARVIRAQTLTLRNRDYVSAARESGERTWRIVIFEILPNEVSLIAASFVGTVLYAILTSVALAFIGVSSFSGWSLGTMLYWAEGQRHPGWSLVVVRAARRCRGAAGYEPRVAQFRARRAGQSEAPRHRSAQDSRPRMAAVRSHAGGARGPRMTDLAQTPAAKRGRAPALGRPVLEISDLSISFAAEGGEVKAVRHVNLALAAGEVVGLAGESGSGKSTLALGACRLLRPPAVITGGSVIYRGRRVDPDGVEILDQTARQLRTLRWREIAIVFQSAMNALNPVLRIRRPARRRARRASRRWTRGETRSSLRAARSRRNPADGREAIHTSSRAGCASAS